MKQLFNLFYFDGTGETPGSPEITAEAAQAADTEVGSPNPAEIMYGKQPAPTDEQAQGKPSDEESEYKHFKAQFKDRYQADLQKVIDKRFKNAKKVEAQRDALLQESTQYQSLIQALSSRYGTQDVGALIEHLTAEEHPQPAAQETENNPAEQEVQTEEHAPQEQLEQLRAQIRQNAIVEQWQNEATELVNIYPDFQLEHELDNPRFALALQSGMTMKDAFQYAHFDEIIGGVIRYTADNVKNALAAARQERSARPVENGVNRSAGTVVKSDVGKLSKADMEEIDKRVLRGERISF